ncbi:MAG: hypothetical protein HY898_15290 [Deltaproteobacteria bacterium]|nr:hypothetical protein [Deltaproteobacteria bacterium]
MKRVFLFLAVALVVGCGESTTEPISSAAGGTSSGGSGGSSLGGAAGTAGAGGAAGGAAGSAGAAGAPTPIRTVQTRSPFGDLAAEPNLILDGDIEFSPASSIVPAWMAIKGQELAPLSYDTGGQCYSGVYCARVPDGVILANFTVSVPPGSTVEASIRVKPEDKLCDGPTVAMYVATGTSDTGTYLASDAPEPDSAGWCLLHGTMQVPKTVRSAAFYVQTNGVALVVDDAIVTQTTTSKAPLSKPLSIEARERGKIVERFRLRRPLRKPAVPQAQLDPREPNPTLPISHLPVKYSAPER